MIRVLAAQTFIIIFNCKVICVTISAFVAQNIGKKNKKLETDEGESSLYCGAKDGVASMDLTDRLTALIFIGPL